MMVTLIKAIVNSAKKHPVLFSLAMMIFNIILLLILKSNAVFFYPIILSCFLVIFVCLFMYGFRFEYHWPNYLFSKRELKKDIHSLKKKIASYFDQEVLIYFIIITALSAILLYLLSDRF